MKKRDIIEKLMKEQQDVYAHTNGCMRVYTIQKRSPDESSTVGFRCPLKLNKELTEVLLKYAPSYIVEQSFNIGITCDDRIEFMTPHGDYCYCIKN
jgi:hypothetical protein